MKRFTVILEDENFYTAVEAEAIKSGRSVDEIAVEALEQWLLDAQMDAQEAAKIIAARKEWAQDGGTEAHEFFETLQDEEPV